MFPFLFFFADYIIFLFKACQNIILTFYSLIKSLPPLIQDLNLIIYFASRSSLPRIKRHTYTYQNIYAKLSFCCILIRFTSVSDKHKIWVLFFTFSNFWWERKWTKFVRVNKCEPEEKAVEILNVYFSVIYFSQVQKSSNDDCNFSIYPVQSVFYLITL